MARALLILAAGLMLLAGACAQTKPAPTPAKQLSFPTFLDAVTKIKGYTYIREAVKFTGLEGTLGNKNLKITAFVPSDKAFDTLGAKFGITRETLMTQKALVKKVLYYHFVNKVLKTGQMTKGMTMTTLLDSKPLTVVTGGLKPTIKSAGLTATVILPNIKCGAGYAHGINSVFVPFSVPDVVSAAKSA